MMCKTALKSSGRLSLCELIMTMLLHHCYNERISGLEVNVPFGLWRSE